MRYLLDTGIWLRLSRAPQTLPEACRALLSAEPQVGLSAVSLRAGFGAGGVSGARIASDIL